jgi:hypothetical protein
MFHKPFRILYKILLKASNDPKKEIKLPRIYESYVENSKKLKHYFKLLREKLELRIVFEDGEEEEDDDEDEEDEEGFDGIEMEKFRGPSTKRSEQEIADMKNRQIDGHVTIEAEEKK